jgi:hypothetical protein
VDLLNIRNHIERAEGHCKELNSVIEELRQHQARIEGDLPLTPREMIEGLRKHALQRIEDGKEIMYYSRDGVVVNTKLSPCNAPQWRVYRTSSGSSWENDHTSKQEVIDEVMEASMFGVNT